MNDFKKEYDLNNDNIITDEEISKVKRMRDATNSDLRADAQRKMTWFALGGMLLYPLCVILSSFVGLDKAADILGDMAATFFISVAGIVSVFFGAEAYKGKHDV